ncbi:MAG: N-acetylmuramoyl-L-alanine amidase [Elusimicrobiaceae bacterium]|nr:N-acetylmuramoyl-L-alanine amidase [Elusimicrobiaceae bacterium]
MNKIPFLLFLLFLTVEIFALPVAPSLEVWEKRPGKVYPITVEYPPENSKIGEGAKGIFIFGKTMGPGLLTINGQKIDLYPTGAYLGYVPVKPGKNELVLEYSSGDKTYQAVRNIEVQGIDKDQYFKTPHLLEGSAFPRGDSELSNTSEITFKVEASPYHKVTVSLPPLFDEMELEEEVLNPNIYKKTVVLGEDKILKSDKKPIYRIYTYGGKYKDKISAEGKIKILPENEIVKPAKVRGQNLRLRLQSNKSGGYDYQTRVFNTVLTEGKVNGFYKVILDDNKIGYLDQTLLDTKKKVSLPRNIIWQVDTQEDDNKTTIIIKNTERISFSTSQTDQSFGIILYNTQAINTFNRDVKTKLVSGLDYEVLSPTTKKITARFQNGKRLRGFNYRYEENNLIFELFTSRDFEFTSTLPLKKLRVVLDPGHSPKRSVPYDGAVGPSGLLEYEMNYKIALAVKKELEKYGALVFLTKDDKETLGLSDRTYRAGLFNPDLFLSLHLNALPDSINPLKRELGFSFYYYYQQGIPLAKAMEKSFSKNIGLPDNGYYQADFAVVRGMPQVPALLIESLYMMVPWQEELLKRQRFIDLLASTIAEGVLYFENPKWAQKNIPLQMESRRKNLEETILKAEDINSNEKR